MPEDRQPEPESEWNKREAERYKRLLDEQDRIEDEREEAIATSNGWVSPSDVRNKLYQMRVTENARRILRAEGEARFPVPDHDSLTEYLDQEDEPVRYAIDELLPAGGNVVFFGSNKAGKTTVVQNVMRSLADGEPFLGRFATHLPEGGRVALINYEMTADQNRRWLRDLEFKHPENVARPWDARGHIVPFWLPEYRAHAAEWFREAVVKFLILDPGQKAWAGFLQSEGDNIGMGHFTQALDLLKQEAEIRDLLLVHHRGWQQFEEDEEHGRGPSALEGWADALWSLSKDRNDDRFLRAYGRDVEVAAFKLNFNRTSRHLSAGQLRKEHRLDEGVRKVCMAVVDQPGINSGDLEKGITGDKNKRSGWIKEAVDRGYVEQVGGANNAKLHYITDHGRTFLTPRIQGSTAGPASSLAAVPSPKGKQGTTRDLPSGKRQGTAGKQGRVTLKQAVKRAKKIE
jgi:AAA domain